MPEMTKVSAEKKANEAEGTTAPATHASMSRRSYRLDREGNVIFTDRVAMLREWAQKYNGTGIPR